MTYEHILSFGCMNNLKEYLMELIVKTLRRYEAVGKEYISSNRWTVQVIASLLQYYSYVGDALKTSEESRIIALKEDDRDRTPLI